MLGFKHIITDKLKKCLMIDDEVTLTHFIHSGWVKNINISTLAFDIA